MFDNFYKDKNILITGHTGFKGSWLSCWLHSLGSHVIGYALIPPTTPNLFEICDLATKTTNITGDVRNARELRNVFEEYQPEIVFHLAAQSLVRHSYKEPVETYETNVMGTVNVLEACRHTPSVRVVVVITSDKCYENYEQPFGYREEDPLGGPDPYSSSKGCAELVSNAYWRSYFNPDGCSGHGVALATVRAGNVIGGGDWAVDRLIPDCLKALNDSKPIILRNPDAIRPWQHVLEPLYGYLLLGQHLYGYGKKYAGAWNFGPNNNDVKPVRWVVEHIAKMWGTSFSIEIKQDGSLHEIKHLKLDCSKAKLKLGWNPIWNLNGALEKTVEWYKAYYNHDAMINTTIRQIREYEEYVKKGINQQYELQIL